MRSVLSLFIGLLLLSSCAAQRSAQTCSVPELMSIHIIDRDGLTESISNQERLKNYAQVDFLEPQPYQKVLRIYSRDDNGTIPAYITTYHPNAQVKQYLEVINGRAFGFYREWFGNGQLKVEATVIEGTGDISLAAEKTWLFDGICKAWDECGNLQAVIQYSRGSLEGTALYYHPNGATWKEFPYIKNNIDGEMRLYFENGELLQTTDYTAGLKNGCSRRYWCGGQLSTEEQYEKGRLISGVYTELQGKKIGGIVNGKGVRAIFGKDSLSELHEYNTGVQEGEVKVFDSKGRIMERYRFKNGCKHGEDITYFVELPGKETQPKISITWYEGKIQGVVKTWFDNGKQESQREMSDNKKNGMATAWYRTGQLMLIEEYERGKLKKGDYFKKGEQRPISQVQNGDGVATFYDSEGNYLRKVKYHQGKPDDL